MEATKSLGWSSFLRGQVSNADVVDGFSPARVVAVHRGGLLVSDGSTEQFIPNSGRWFVGNPINRPSVGDWVLVDPASTTIVRLIDRTNVLCRRIRRSDTAQVIAANVDVIFAVFSCNQDFNESRLERYLTLAETSNAEAHIVLTKVDLYDEFESYVKRAEGIAFGVPVHAVNSLDKTTVEELREELPVSRTGIFVGSSGVGKSTIINTLVGTHTQRTHAVRVRDARGRHTTSSRRLLRIPEGGMVVDVPGTRTIELVGDVANLPKTFPDIEELISGCRYANCSHRSEQGCLIQASIEQGSLDRRRFRNYSMLVQSTTRRSDESR